MSSFNTPPLLSPFSSRQTSPHSHTFGRDPGGYASSDRSREFCSSLRADKLPCTASLSAGTLAGMPPATGRGTLSWLCLAFFSREKQAFSSSPFSAVSASSLGSASSTSSSQISPVSSSSNGSDSSTFFFILTTEASRACRLYNG